ncbi:YqiA/YcfP family alpha/beta fold hydrolase [Limnohabitans sp. 63ED37-2]|uniref:YqiA/YcfP family alpha/beta fold hydrolase n=1 Tax=Limnohabitans sp. 63ED37-2 TaxID=1678128 RepID=UPI000705A13C|nr:YqiA/YcfP family alpha/beta fold hydrolase [Limnohabitans sp. 63ED37-2]ALK89465.1 esterase YqiA [Limnohabitans sp. 63ED37-2]
MSTTHLLYLHGFRSSPQSAKAQIMARLVQSRHLGVTWWCPQLPASPAQAMALLLKGTAAWPRGQMSVMGSSLGGFYAAWLSAHWDVPAVLINPAVHPSRDLARYIGEHPVWQDPAQSIFFEPTYVQELMQLESQPLPTRPATLALIAKGDEVLDWREMLARHQSGQVRLIEGSDHALSDFEDHLPQILDFLQLA